MTSVDNEKYNCLLPETVILNQDSGKYNYDGPTAKQLLRPLFTQMVFSYRLEHFWTYELCHGRFLRQYHEENTIHGSFTQEYILGLYDVRKLKEDSEDTDEQKSNQIVPNIKINSQETPYFEINMTDGTVCDVNGQPRFSRVLYACGEKTHEIYSLREASSCEYEVIVLTSYLCKHPGYRIKKVKANEIYCHSINGSPNKPIRLLNLENENYELSEENNNHLPVTETPNQKPQTESTPHDEKIIQDFLNGDYCLHGGSGWWKYEFCYGKKVEQYHEEKNKQRTVILLGSWKVGHHLEWLKKNPSKRPKEGLIPRQVSHFYSEGTICDITGKPRQTEVRLKCKEIKGHPDVVSLYLNEPKYCEYVLGVESPIICPLLETVDRDGLFHSKS
ncbi:endoplasmic reticulum lectin 1-like isoform X2 [Centruroides sculpturatus]|uniref:endoplasmic reticulum lectin 1-like isoform X1 n=1 Tax=Centruroides sculpturatus TaxID=218467 RepID=UPI000C6E3420|nr:endoplasmic reticulum lectin 1-like isoform X1 [Centruroides sculpturatus]XP_023229504.1 endoplasmic reticulum lectin 1-like isoform X2 [Centruroides sculpturatus]